VVAGSGNGSSSSGEHGKQQHLCCVSCIEDALGKEGRRKRYSNWAKELGCTRDRAGLVTKEVDGLSGKKIKWADLIFEFCFYYLLSLLRGEKFLWGFFYLLITLIQVTKVWDVTSISFFASHISVVRPSNICCSLILLALSIHFCASVSLFQVFVLLIFIFKFVLHCCQSLF
jgi:hypothetical protein